MSTEQSRWQNRWQDIADRLRRGDSDALDDVFTELGPMIAARLTRQFSDVLSVEDIEDVMAQMLYRVWVHRNRYQPERAPFGLWCSLIARNLALDAVRAKGRQRTALIAIWNELRDRPKPEESPVQSPGLAALRRLLADLSAVDRQILLASVGGEEAWAAKLAAELGLSAGTIRQRRFRALARLREAMAALGYS